MISCNLSVVHSGSLRKGSIFNETESINSNPFGHFPKHASHTEPVDFEKKKSLKIAFLRASMARICEMDRTKANINSNKCGKIADIIGLNENAMQFKFNTKILAYILVGRIYCSFELMN